MGTSGVAFSTASWWAAVEHVSWVCCYRRITRESRRRISIIHSHGTPLYESVPDSVLVLPFPLLSIVVFRGIIIFLCRNKKAVITPRTVAIRWSGG
mmetsp:Transcript_30271/g.51480  ORF Transcript_30271/g.51480 Transcript_30271/m.51480 type:complete len:96 (-) Transcript_30271:803-1090(-)